jgi:GNAT superfamily N-acetyltransferase
MWVHEAWRRKGVTALLFDEAARAMIEMGIEEIDASWVRTDNEAAIRSIENAGGSAMRRYRMYSMQI